MENLFMSEEKVEEETYSVIFKSLKHPIRRKILRMLLNEDLTFSHILDALSIDSGHLSYHIENLGDLITRSREGKYGLSSIGVAAVKLMSGVEEHPAIPTHKRAVEGLDIMKVYPLILVVILILAGLYFTNFTMSVKFEDRETTPETLISIRPGETFEFNVTIVFGEGMDEHRTENNALYVAKAPPINTLTLQEKGSFWFGLEGNGPYTMQTTVCSPIETDIGKWHVVIINGTQIYGTQILVYKPTRTVTSRQIFVNWHGRVLGSGRTEISQAGTYTFEIKNLGAQEISGFLSVHLRWELFHKPYFIFGIAAISLALIYPVLILLNSQKGLKIRA